MSCLVSHSDQSIKLGRAVGEIAADAAEWAERVRQSKLGKGRVFLSFGNCSPNGKATLVRLAIVLSSSSQRNVILKSYFWQLMLKSGEPMKTQQYVSCLVPDPAQQPPLLLNQCQLHACCLGICLGLGLQELQLSHPEELSAILQLCNVLGTLRNNDFIVCKAQLGAF